MRNLLQRRAGRGVDGHGLRPPLLQHLLAGPPSGADQRGQEPPPEVHGRLLQRALRRGKGMAPLFETPARIEPDIWFPPQGDVMPSCW